MPMEVNPRMTDKKKVEYLLHGLHDRLEERVMLMKPETPEKFLADVNTAFELERLTKRRVRLEAYTECI